MNEVPLWFEYLKALAPALIALFVAYIAYQQWLVNRSNLKEKLFDRRFEIFKGTQRFLSHILRDAKVSDDQLFEFFDVVQRSRFMFDKEIHLYLVEVRKRALKLQTYQAELLELEAGTDRKNIVHMKYEQLKWLTDQGPKIFDIFAPYMSFGRNR
ncbi:MAG: hypothetical protein AAGF36_03490 [Pseudomonadota bacterium]